MIASGVQLRGHTVVSWVPQAMFNLLPFGRRFKKWLGYVDQFIIFPLLVKWRLRKMPLDTVFVFSDQALGPWVPLVAGRPHVVHINDLLAVRSAVGEFPQNSTSWSGQIYQALIRRGLGHGRCFISISENTRKDLHRFLPSKPPVSEVVYLGLNFPFHRMSQAIAALSVAKEDLSLPQSGFLLHVGGNQWYKNREGVIEIYRAYAEKTANPLPLWMVGAVPTEALNGLVRGVPNEGVVRFLPGLSNQQVCAVYSLARLTLFPSLAEGFGWPILEAMACGCLVLTTGEAPMTEVGGSAAFYIPPKPMRDVGAWAEHAAERIAEILALLPEEVSHRRQIGFNQVAQFDAERSLDAYECIYQQALAACGK
ncbi:MAG: glycosyltransferase family 4 protein [Glaciimonas sp.]|nr:glycosyltransferase family 4 protein [Glaciimonas sp.]